MADPAKTPAPASTLVEVDVKPPAGLVVAPVKIAKWVRVRMLQSAFIATRNSSGRHWLQDKDEVVEVLEQNVNPALMVAALDGEAPPAAPPEPPPTTLPTAPRMVTVSPGM